ncbi:dihydrofolate reductase [Candidatus Synchoanobacter obligatus]|uniref:Dihydrofolate reductase n=1 Tax=Candidatus Synchoanobacter obligatus TaxID=2919597 RepID=A0ABT1L511_9GAMM|nr:dihydrofolate reductase [Candidatus Synchoanobacter obligatus]MCP8352041.1 dihydrofolate reductase [Candidatus Synchoanobacter obligatus]
MNLSIIAAFDHNQLIGNNNKLPWSIPEDLAYFKKHTLNGTIVMGRKTFDSIGRALPKRKNIIISSHHKTYPNTSCIHHPSMLFELETTTPIFIIGGRSIYQFFLPYTQTMIITHIDHAFKGDCHFPTIDWQQWSCQSETIVPAREDKPFTHRYCIYQRQDSDLPSGHDPE